MGVKDHLINNNEKSTTISIKFLEIQNRASSVIIIYNL